MNIRLKPRDRRAAGYALLMVLILAAVSIVALTATMSRNASDAKMNERNNLYVTDLFAAEAAVEKVIGRMKVDYFAGGDGYITNNLSIYRAMRPLASEDPYWGNFQFSDAGVGNSTYVQCISNKTWTALQSQYVGLKGWTSVYRVLSNTRQVGGLFNLTNAVQEDIEFDSLPVFQFAIFYNGLMEFTWAATLTVNGRVHANGNVFVGSSAALTFNSTVTSTASVLKTNWDGHTLAEYAGAINYNGTPGYSTNCQVLTLPVGTNNSPGAVREILNQPPSGEDPLSAIGEQRYFNKAQVVLLVSNTTVTVSLKISPSDTPTVIQANYFPTNFASSNYVQIATNFPFLTLTNQSFYDDRELGKRIKTTQINVGAYKNWLITNAYVTAKFPAVSGVLPNVLYVADNRTNSSTELVAVRLTNGVVIPTNTAPSGAPTGWTVATPNPLYILGNYNCPDAGALGTNDTTKTFPASLISDALTVLSPTWSDAASTGSYSSRNAGSTTINAAILTGIVYSTGPGATEFSGGVMNLPRLLENWTGDTLTLNTSIVNLFNSVRATNQFQNPGVYYNAPTRQFSFDQNFMSDTKLPPGTPLLGIVYRSKWAVPPPNTTTYAGQ